MKCSRTLLLPALLLAVVTTPNFSRAQGSGYSVTERGADYQVWQKTTVEHGTNRIHRYVELAAGMNFTNASGQLVPSREQITLLPQGGAVAVRGQHQVYFPADIFNGVIDLITPDGRELRSRPLGVSYDDGTNTVFIATLTNSVGWLTSSNQVTYPNAFSGLKADLVCTYRKSGFECDLVFRQSPPKPAQFGLSNARSTVQLVTEFFNTTDPQQIPAQSDAKFGLQDSTLQFGRMTMTQGKAFAVGGGGQTNLLGRLKAGMTSVYKRWIHAGGRTFLIEEVPLVHLTNDLAALPLTASVALPGGQRLMAAGHREFPAAHGLLADTNQILLASADLNRSPGVVLDYVAVNSGGDYTFSAGTTYYVSGPCYFNKVTLNGGAVIKYANVNSATASVEVDGTLTCNTSADSPAIFTAADDNTVGETIYYSTGSPAGNFYANPAIYAPGSVSLSNVRISYAEQGVWVMSGNLALTDSEVKACQAMAVLGSGGYGSGLTLTCNNCLCDAPYYGIFMYDNGGGGNHYNLTNCTLNNVYYLVAGENYYYSNQGNAVNCIFASGYMNVTGYCTWSGSHNGFYYAGTPFGSSTTNITTNPFQTGGNAGFYLTTGSAFRNVGTTAISSTLLADLQARTTFAPQAGSYPDNDGMPDLGWHYSVNEDSDYDGLPDWWEWHWFGNFTHSGSDSDSTGSHTLGYDYTNGLDPNVIEFTIATTNNYVHVTNASVQLSITAGVPAKYAVSVDDTNYAADASWQTFTTTNLTVNLGSTQGWHDVWIALKGPATNATVTWEWKRLKLDTTAPQLTITSPTNGTVMQPVIQVTGFSPENLAGICYDLTNALGLVTNQQVLITDESFSTNTWEFTTNYFQCFDVAITNGVNTFTFHATDLAGNTSTLTTNFTLNYAGKTAPLVQLYWPTNGMEICGNNIVCRGQVSDPTATVIVQLVDATGATNNAGSLVGRDGLFYADSLTLAAGTNHLSYTVTDAAGNVATTNITVATSDLGLTLDAVVAGQTLVTGTIDDPSYTIYVNGVQATIDGNGWSATITPISGTGGAVVVNAVKNGGDPSLQQIVEVPQGVYIVSSSYQDREDWGNEYVEGGSGWADDAGGWLAGQSFDGSQTWDDSIDWSASPWPGAVPWGTLWITNNGQFYGYTHRQASLSFNYANVNVKVADPLTGSSFSESAQGALEFAAGGPLGSKAVRLWQFSGSVTVHHHPQPPDNDSVPWAIPPEDETVADGRVSLENLGNLDANGNVYALLVDNTRVLVTPAVKGADDYSTPPPTPVVVTLTGLTVVSNATQIDTTNWACVKTNDYVYVKAMLSDMSDTNAAKAIHWSVGEQVSYDPFQVKVSKATSQKILVKATLGSASTNLNVWVIWATFTKFNNTGPTDPDCDVSPNVYGATNPVSNDYGAINGMLLQATVSPNGVTNLPGVSFQFVRTTENNTWGYFNGNWQSMNKYSPPGTPDGPAAANQDVRVSSTSHIYNEDNPGLGYADGTYNTGDQYASKFSFVEWINVSLEGWQQCSDNYPWHSITWIQMHSDGYWYRVNSNNEIEPGSITIGNGATP